MLDDASGDFDPNDVDIFDTAWKSKDLTLTCQILCFRNWLATYDDRNTGLAEVDERGERLAEAAERIWNRILTRKRSFISGRKQSRKRGMNRQFIWAFFRPEEVLIGRNRVWRGRILEFYSRHWDELDEVSQLRLVNRFSNAVVSFLESSKKEQVDATVLASKEGIEFFDFVNRKVRRRPRPRDAVQGWSVDDRRWTEVVTLVHRTLRLQSDGAPFGFGGRASGAMQDMQVIWNGNGYVSENGAVKEGDVDIGGLGAEDKV
ncbi:hypothetical protein L218DRAFT_111875 [Marasmius fiardii PR-910]|nr:hypothetical protein L218DRAFT_111875 [Marasmius fiardii PR-910]